MARSDDLETLRQLKARYCFLVDTKRWPEWRDLFTDDCEFDFAGLPYGRATADQFVAGASTSLAHARSVHQVHSPAFEFTGPDTARGTWAMFDWLEFPPEHPSHRGHPHRVGYGYYEEEYRREGDTWRISFMRVTRLRVDRLGPDAIVTVDDLGPTPDPAAWLGGAERVSKSAAP